VTRGTAKRVNAVKAQTTYKQNVAAVNQLVTGVLASALPTLQSNPPDWQNFVSAYEASQSSALDWVNCVMGRLLSVPGDVQTYDMVVTTAPWPTRRAKPPPSRSTRRTRRRWRL
jgi:hypothetical protein